MDADGYLWFRGRLGRFLKAGGEMISLPALEEPFVRRYPPTGDGPRVAVEGVEHEGGRQVVLFTTEPLDLREANALLLREGFHGVMRLDEVRRMETDPDAGHRQDRLQTTSGPDPGGNRGPRPVGAARVAHSSAVLPYSAPFPCRCSWSGSTLCCSRGL